MSRIYNGDLAVLSAGGVDMLALVENVTYRPSVDKVDGKALARPGKTAQAMGFGGEISASVHSSLSAPTRVSHLDISSFTLDGTAYDSMLVSANIQAAYEVRPGKPAGDWWRVPVVTDKNFLCRCEVMVPRSGTANALRDIFNQMHSGTPADLNMNVQIVVNGVTTTISALLDGGEVGHSQGDLLRVQMTFDGRCPDSGAYPAAPTGNTTLFEKALNAPGTPIAFSFTPHDDVGEGANWAGNMVYGSYELSAMRDDLIRENFNWLTTGPVTQTNT